MTAQEREALRRLCAWAVRHSKPGDMEALSAVAEIAPDDNLRAAAGNMLFAASRFNQAQSDFDCLLGESDGEASA